MANVTGTAVCEHSTTACGVVWHAAPRTATGVALSTHEAIGCSRYFGGNNYVNGTAIRAYDQIGCTPFTLGITPDAQINEWQSVDLIYSVWAAQEPLTLDGATVEWVCGSTTKSTDDYSVITFGNTLIVHINPGDFKVHGTLDYTATITTVDSTSYTMTGRLIIAETPLDVCFMRNVVLTARLITAIPTIQRQVEVIEALSRTSTSIGCEQRTQQVTGVVEREVETKGLVEREPSNIICARIPPQIIQITERTSDVVTVAPCGKRVLRLKAEGLRETKKK